MFCAKDQTDISLYEFLVFHDEDRALFKFIQLFQDIF